MLNKITLYLLLCYLNLFANDGMYLKYFDVKTDSYYVKVKDITKPIKLIQMTGIPYLNELVSLSDNIKLLHASAGAQGTSVLIDYNYTYILDMKKKSVIGFLQYDDDNGHYSKEDKTPKWKLNEHSLEVNYYSLEDNKYKKIDFDFLNIENIKKSEKEFQKKYKEIQSAIQKKDASSFYYSISANFNAIDKSKRVYDNRTFPFSIQNFMKYFSYKNELNSYDILWEELELYFKNNIFVKKENNLICLPQENYNNQKGLDSFLCFKKYNKDNWLIEHLILSRE